MNALASRATCMTKCSTISSPSRSTPSSDRQARQRPKPAASEGHAIRESVTHIQNHVKNILRQLKPVSQLEFGLEPAVQDLVAFWARRHPDIAFEQTITLGAGIGRPQEEAAYRVVQEALSNAMRHGAPKTIKIAIRADGQQLSIGIADDGGGIKLGPDAVASAGHGGLANMRERIQALGGRFIVHQSDGGVRITGILPLASERIVA